MCGIPLRNIEIKNNTWIFLSLCEILCGPVCLLTRLPGVSLILSVRATVAGCLLTWLYRSWSFLNVSFVFTLYSRLHTLTSLDGLLHSMSHRSGLLCLLYLSRISAGWGKGSKSSFSKLSSGPRPLIFNTLLRTSKFLCRIMYLDIFYIWDEN